MHSVAWRARAEQRAVCLSAQFESHFSWSAFTCNPQSTADFLPDLVLAHAFCPFIA